MSYVISREQCRDNWQRTIFDSAFAQGAGFVVDGILKLHFVNSDVAAWNVDGEDLCDACLVPFPCSTIQFLDSL